MQGEVQDNTVLDDLAIQTGVYTIGLQIWREAYVVQNISNFFFFQIENNTSTRNCKGQRAHALLYAIYAPAPDGVLDSCRVSSERQLSATGLV